MGGIRLIKFIRIPLARAQLLATEYSIIPFLYQILQPTIDETALMNGFNQSAMASNLSLTTQPIASDAQRRLAHDSDPILSNNWSILQTIPETPRRSSMAGYYNMDDGALVSDFGSVYTSPVYQAPQFQLLTERKRGFDVMSETSSSTVVGDRRMSHPSLRRASNVSLSQFSTALPNTQHDAELESLFDSSAQGNTNTANDLTTFWASMAKDSLVAPETA